jgi:recombination associated protein RdgC
MDLVDLITEKRFVGQEFLTWLWWKSEERGGSVELGGQGDITVVFEKHMLLEYGEADYNERLVCSGLQTELKEARTGLRTGKKPEQARLQIIKDEKEYNLTLGASFFEFRNVRLPKTEAADSTSGNSDAEMEGAVLERIYLFEELVKIVNDLLRMFAEVRTSDRWPEEVARVRAWVHKSADSV